MGREDEKQKQELGNVGREQQGVDRALSLGDQDGDLVFACFLLGGCGDDTLFFTNRMRADAKTQHGSVRQQGGAERKAQGKQAGASAGRCN